MRATRTLLFVLAVLAFLRQRRRPIPHPPPLTFLFENPIVEAFVGPATLIERLHLAPGMRVLDAGCGPGRLTVPLARAVGEDGEVVALVRGREAAVRELYAALRPGGILSVTEIFGDPDYRRPATVRREVEVAGFRLVERHGGFPAYTLNFRKPETLTAEQAPPEALAL
jgi:hypothetical protein